MYEDNKTYFKVGLFVATGLIFAMIIFLWQKKILFGGDSYKITVKFDNIAGLESGDPTMVNGVKKGYVEDIILIDNEPVVTIRLQKDVKIKEDYSIGIFMLDLMGGKKVEINPGKSIKYANISEPLIGKFYADISTLISFVGNMTDDIELIVSDLRNIIEKLYPILNDKEIIDNIKGVLKNSNDLALKANRLLAKNENNIDSITLAAFEILKKSNSFFDRNEASLSKSFENLLAISEKANKLLNEIDGILQETKSEKNNIGKLFYDENILSETKELLKQTNDLIKIILEQARNKGIKVDANLF